ncbi:MAG: tRNA (N6-threonylcarbamoyladenosine(37)-N6)-methyltransferase TrmO [Patescibacteria group bacterium]
MTKLIQAKKVEYCEFLDSIDKKGRILLVPIGKAKNTAKKPALTGWKNSVTEIVLEKRYAKGLDGIEEYSHVIIVYWLGQEKNCHIKHHPQGRKDVPYGGIYACRCPQRPNRIAISTVKLLSRKVRSIKVKGLDILDGTPILDIKPYTPQYDLVGKAKVPKWVNRLIF